MEISDKNIYEKIIKFANDRTILNMIKTCPEFNKPVSFIRISDFFLTKRSFYSKD